MKHYVTFQFRRLFAPIEKYAVQCRNFEQAREVASDANSLDGIMYLRISTNPRLSKDVKIITDAKNYLREVE